MMEEVDLEAASERLAKMGLHGGAMNAIPQSPETVLTDGNVASRNDLCPRCGRVDAEWLIEIREGTDVDLTKLKNNQRAGFGTGRNDHTVYTHLCTRSKLRSDAGKPREAKIAQLGVKVTIPGAVLDLGYPEARSILEAAITTWAPRGYDSETIWEIIDQLLKEIDRLRTRAQEK